MINLNNAVKNTYDFMQENQGETGTTSFNPRFAGLKKAKLRIQNDSVEVHNFFLYPDMKYYFVIYLFHFANMLYTLCAVPLQVFLLYT